MIISSKCKTTNIKKINETLELVTFKIEKYVPWEPGMFLQLALDKYDPSEPWPESRAFSFASYGDKKAKILVRKSGEFTKRIFNELRPDEEFYIRYSFGDFILSDPGDKVFIAAGTGISVFLSYIDFYIKEKPQDNIIIFHSVKTSDELIRNYLDLSIPQKIKIYSFVTKEKIQEFPNRRIEITDIINKLDSRDCSFYICGNDNFVKKYESELRSESFNNIFTESWNRNYNPY